MKPGIYRISTLCMAAAIAFLSLPTWAQDTALSTSGDWSTGSNWTAGEPTGTDVAEIGDGLTGQITESNEVAQTLNIANAGGAGTLEISAGHLAVENMVVGVDTNGTIGTVTQTGGTIDINVTAGDSFGIGNEAGAVGIYTISSGTLNYNSGTHFDMVTAGSATLNISGDGAFNFGGSGRPHLSVDPGSSTIINMSGGRWDSDNTYLGESGYFELNLSDGIFSPNDSSYLANSSGGTGIIHITGGEFRPNKNFSVGATGARAEINISGGAWSRGSFKAGGGSQLLTISGTNATVTMTSHIEFNGNSELHLELDGGVSEIHHTASAAYTILLGGTLRIGMLDGGAVPGAGSISVLRADNVSITNETFDTVVWEDGLSGDVVYDYLNNQVRLENVTSGASPLPEEPEFTEFELLNDEINAVFPSEASVVYRLWYTTDLTATPVVWDEADTAVGDGGDVGLVDDNPVDPLRVYRITAE